jgi:hypothetical protein
MQMQQRSPRANGAYGNGREGEPPCCCYCPHVIAWHPCMTHAMLCL